MNDASEFWYSSGTHTFLLIFIPKPDLSRKSSCGSGCTNCFYYCSIHLFIPLHFNFIYWKHSVCFETIKYVHISTEKRVEPFIDKTTTTATFTRRKERKKKRRIFPFFCSMAIYNKSELVKML